MSASQRRKGASYEREIAHFLSTIYGHPVKRNLSQARDGGDDIRVGGLVVECKRRSKIAMLRWYEQAAKAAHGTGCTPVVVMREDNGESYALLKLTDLFGAFLASYDSYVRGQG